MTETDRTRMAAGTATTRAATKKGGSREESVMKRKSSVVVLFLLLLPCCRPVWGQPARSQAVIKPVYFAAIEALNRGRYKQATDGFKQAGRNAIRFGDQRWVDSICYYTMLGEALYRQGQLDEARNYFESALSI